MEFLVFLAVIAFLTLFVGTKSFKIIGQAEVMVIERLGRFHRIARSGFNILIPFIERPKSIDVRYFEADVSGAKRITAAPATPPALRAPGFNFPPQPVITKDNVSIHTDTGPYLRGPVPQEGTYLFPKPPY